MTTLDRGPVNWAYHDLGQLLGREPASIVWRCIVSWCGPGYDPFRVST